MRPLPKPAEGPIVRRSPRADPGPFILRYCNGVVDEATEVRSLTISPPIAERFHRTVSEG